MFGLTTELIIVQFLGILVIVCCVIMPHMKTKTSMLMMNFVNCMLQLISFFILNASTGVSHIIGTIVRTVVFYIYAKHAEVKALKMKKK